MEKYKVTILLATFNRAHLIKETLDSIKNQTYNNWECIIVDDNSEDETTETVKKYCNSDSRFTYFLKTPKYQKGLSGTRNFGLDMALQNDSEFIQFFDDDDLMHPKKLEYQIAPFKKKPNLNFTVCNYEKLFKKNGAWKIEKINSQMKFPHLGDAILTGKMKMNSLGPLWRRDFIQKFRFDENLKYAEEWELYVRLGYLHPGNYEFVDESLFQYRKHHNTLTLGNDPEFERRKTSAIIRIKILDFLSTHQLHTKISVLFLANTFLLYDYKPNLVKGLLTYVKQHKEFSKRLIYFLKTGLIAGKIYRRSLRRLAKWV